MKSLSLLATLFLLCGGAMADKVDDFVRQEMARQHIPGVSIAVLQRDRVVKLKGYGLANVELGVRATPETVYEIGSLTKQFTAFAIMQLVEAGKLALDDKIAKYLANTPVSWKDITVRQLLNHVSGIRSYTSLPAFFANLARHETEDEVLKFVADAPLDFKPGTKWSYDNSGYFLLGMIVEKVSGQSYGDYLSVHILRPLGMSCTGLNDWQTVVPNRAAGYAPRANGWQNAQFVSMSWPFSAGAMLSSASDFAVWMAAIDREKLLAKSSYDQIFTSARLPDGSSCRYGFGWVVDQSRGQRRYWHTGGIPGFSTAVVRWPAQALSVVVFTNNEAADADVIANGIGGIYVPSLMSPLLEKPKPDPNPAFTASLKELIVRFGRGDTKVDCATDRLQKSVDAHAQKTYADTASHMKGLHYIDSDPPTPRSVRLYFEVDRDDGRQLMEIEVIGGKVAGVWLSGVKNR